LSAPLASTASAPVPTTAARRYCVILFVGVTDEWYYMSGQVMKMTPECQLHVVAVADLCLST
jgi:hypothetical protein